LEVYKTTVTLKDIDPLALLGPNDKLLALLEDKFGIDLVIRGHSLLLRGQQSPVGQAKTLIDHLIKQVHQGQLANLQDVEALIDEMAVSLTPLEEGEDPLYRFKTYLTSIIARTNGQRQYFKAIRTNDIVFAIGPAGTGKTFIAVAAAVASLRQKEVSRIVLARPAVEAGEHLGFLPGALEDKVDPYLRPLYDALQDLLEPERLRRFQDMKIIEVVPLAYMRGRTLNEAFIILDEAQNTTPQQMKMFLTRLGTNSKAVITGDITQTDLAANQPSGLIEVQHIFSKIKGLDFIYLSDLDVVRNPLVQAIIKAYENFDAMQDAADQPITLS
jgi:phosphate starvation-inducible PhoH-like protein